MRTTQEESSAVEAAHDDHALFGSLLKRIVRAAPNEDPSVLVLEAVGRSVGADRCYVYRFWEPGKTSMCTNTHEWCAEGIAPAIGGQQACNLADLVDFNACITSGRDFKFTDISDVDPGSRDWLAPQGIKSLVATPLVGAGDVILGFAGFDFVKAPCAEFTDRIISNIHCAADLLLNCHMLHERDMALQDATRGKNEYEENEREFERALIELQKDVGSTHPKQMLEIVRKRMDTDLCYIVQIHPDGSGEVNPDHLLVRNGWTNTRKWALDPDLGRVFDTRLKTSSVVTFHGNEFDWIRSNSVMEDSMPASLAQLKILHCFGVRNEGRLVGVLCIGYNDERGLSKPLADFLRRAALVIVTTLERIDTYHDLSVAMNIAHLKGEIIEFMFKHLDYEEVKEFLGAKVCEYAEAQHLMLCSDDGSRSDWFGADAPVCCRDCAKAAADFGKRLPLGFFSESETVIVAQGEPLPDMNLPPYCPMTSSVVAQFRKGDGWWRLVADYTKPHRHDLNEVAGNLRMALELLSIAYDRERHEKTIATLQEHLRFRADMLAYALSEDDIPGLVDITMHRLLELTACDYISIHTVDGDHRILKSGGKLEQCPARCKTCPFYNFDVPFAKEGDHIIELDDTRGQMDVHLPPECPAKSLAIVVVCCEGKTWGGIALHYLNKQFEISKDDRDTLKIAAGVLSLALERHVAAVRLKAERDRVVEAEKARNYFFSAVSHDIRTPLNAIIGFSELLAAGGVSGKEAKQYLKMIVSSGKTLLQLINDVLDLSKMDLGKMQFSLEPTNVSELVGEMVPMFEPMARGKNQKIVVDVPDTRRFMVDPHRFKQLLFNFIGNAVKYAGPCTISVKVEYADGIMTTTVSDDGKGVSVEKARRLMQPFVQADIKNRTEGSGLGLAICKKLVELAKGTVSIETAPGKGFKIQTSVPVSVASSTGEDDGRANHPPAVLKAADLPRRVLVVDDSPVNRAVLKAMLKKLGITNVEMAEDGRAALDVLERGQAFDIVLSDMWMPVMDGAELVRRIRADERLAGMKVCSITADVEALTGYRDQGFDLLLLKPVTLEKLSEIFGMLSDGNQRT